MFDVGRSSVRCFLIFHGKQHPDFIERAEVGGQFHARLGVKAEFGLARIHDLADGNSRGKNPAFAAGDHLLAGFQIRVAGQIGQIRRVNCPAARRGDDAHVVRRIEDARGNAAARVANQNDLRTRVADGRNAADQAVGGQHGKVFADAVALAEVNLNGAPPVGRVAQDDAGELEFPRLLPLPADERAELVVFARGGGGLRVLDFEAAGFRGGEFRFPGAIRCGAERCRRPGRQLPGGVDGPEQRQKQSADGEFEMRNRAGRQA